MKLFIFNVTIVIFLPLPPFFHISCINLLLEQFKCGSLINMLFEERNESKICAVFGQEEFIKIV